MSGAEIRVLDDRVEADRTFLAQLRDDPTIEEIDALAGQRAELDRIRPPLPAEILTEPGRWVYYPWRRAVVSLLGPTGFRILRLDRNRNKITRDEQDGFAALAIGVVGLSVGHAIAHTLALEGLCGELRLADFDEIELSNLNRIPGSVFDLSVNKAVVAARRIAELDPYLRVTVFPKGLLEDNAEEFFEGLGVVIEECDSLDIKVMVREQARRRRIPVLMETSDRGLFDVERFDLDADLPLFHGLLGDVDPASLQGLSTSDKVPHVMRIIDATGLSARMAASLVEVDETLTTWPQLGSDVILGGATVSAAVRRFGRGEPLASGRVRVDLETRLDQLELPPTDGGAPLPAPEDPFGEIVTPSQSPEEAVVKAVALAPSGGNVQPWSVTTDEHRLAIHLEATRTSAMDVAFRGSYVGIGAGLFNARVAAAAHGVGGPVAIQPDGPDSTVLAELRWGTDADPELAALYPAMLRRISNRHPGTPAPVTAEMAAVLAGAAAAEGGGLRLVTDPRYVTAGGELLARSDQARYLTPMLHQQMMSELVWPGRDRLDLGLDVRTLELEPDDLAKLDVARRADVMGLLARWGGGHALGDSTRERVESSSALAVITVAGDRPADFVRGGQALERTWIAAEGLGLAVQPVSPVFLFALEDTELQAMSPAFAGDLSRMRADFRALIGAEAGESMVLVLRLSHAPPPTARSRRLALDAIWHPDLSLVQSALTAGRGKEPDAGT